MKQVKSLFSGIMPFIALVFIFTSCVSTKKYQTLEQENNNLKAQLRKGEQTAKTASEKATETYQGAMDKMRVLEAEKTELEKEITVLNEDKKSLETRINTLIYDQTNQTNTMATEFKKLNEELTKKEKELVLKEDAVATAESELKKAQVELQKAQTALSEKEQKNATLASSLQEREKRVNELEAAIQAQENQSKILKDKLSGALLGFNEADLSVEQRNGKVYVSLSQDLLFASGSATINKNGKDALAKLAAVMKKNPDIDITIEGHTDNVPFRGRGDIKDNWDLSVLRSTAIVRELVNNGVAPTQILASGRGEHYPISDNSTKDGRAKNRRSDIILSPKLDELYNIINQ